MKRYRLGIVLSHPVEHFAPFFRRLAKEPELEIKVYYYSTQGVQPSFDDGFGVKYQWDVPLLEGYPYEVLPTWSGRISSKRSSWSINPGIWGVICRRRFDAVLFYGWRMLSNWIGFLACIRSGTPILLIGDTTREHQRPGWHSWLRRKALTWLFSGVAVFLVTSPRNREFYQNYGVSDSLMFFVPLSPDIERFQKEAAAVLPNRSNVRATYGLPPELPLIIFPGKLIPRKRPFDLLRALRVLQAAGLQAGLIVVGDGSERATLDRYVHENSLRNVYFLGFRNQSEMPALYAISDIFVLPSEWDPNALAVLEAMACGLPCVLSEDVGRWGENDAVRPAQNGYVFPTGQIDELADRLRRLLINDDLRRRMSEASLALVQNWSYDSGVIGILQALRAICSREPRE